MRFISEIGMTKYFIEAWFYEREVYECEFCKIKKPVTLFAWDIICKKCVKEQYHDEH